MSKLFFTIITIFAFSFGAMAQDTQEAENRRDIVKTEYDQQSNTLHLLDEQTQTESQISTKSPSFKKLYKRGGLSIIAQDDSCDSFKPSGNLELDLKAIMKCQPEQRTFEVNFSLNKQRMDSRSEKFFYNTENRLLPSSPFYKN